MPGDHGSQDSSHALCVRIKSSGLIVPVTSLTTAVIGIIDGTLEVAGDPSGQAMIDERLGRAIRTLSAEEKEKMERHQDPAYWKSMGIHDYMKGTIRRLWENGGKRRGYITVGEMLAEFNRDPNLKRYQPTTLDARIRELADKGFEKPPFLFHFAEGERTGRYLVNPVFEK